MKTNKEFIEYVNRFQEGNEYGLHFIENNLGDGNYKDGEENKKLSQNNVEHILDFLYATKKKYKLGLKTILEKANAWNKKLIANASKKDNEIEGEDYEVIKDFKDGFRFVKLISEESYKREGANMSHCVSSFYGRDVEIFSLRDSKNLPHCTIDSEGNNVKGKGNQSVDNKYFGYCIKFLEEQGMTIGENEMKNIGYFKLDTIDKDLVVEDKYLWDGKYISNKNLDKIKDKEGNQYQGFGLLNIKSLFEFDLNMKVKFNFDIKKITSYYKKNIESEIAGDNATVSAGYNAKVLAEDNAKVLAGNNAKVSAECNAIVSARDNAKVSVGYNTTVSAEDNATVSAGDNAKVSAGYNTTVSVEDNAKVSAEYNATVSAECNATVSAGDNAKVSAGDNAKVSAGNNAKVSEECNATVSAKDNAKVSAGYNATVSAEDNAKVSVGENAKVSVGYNAKVSAGYNATVSAGDNAKVSAGNSAKVSVGEQSNIITGRKSELKSLGKNTLLLGRKDSKAKGKIGTWIILTEEDNDFNILNVQTVRIDGNKIKEDTFYILKGGEFKLVT